MECCAARAACSNVSNVAVVPSPTNAPEKVVTPTDLEAGNASLDESKMNNMDTPSSHQTSTAFDAELLLNEMIEASKSTCHDVPTVLAWYTQCPPECSPENKFELLVKGTAIHTQVCILYSILNIVFFLHYEQCASSGAAEVCVDYSYFDTFSFINIFLAIAWFAWCVVLAKHPDWCCCSQCIGMWIFTIITCWGTLWAVISVFAHISVLKYVPGLYFNVVLWFFDTVIMVPTSTFALRSAQHVQQQRHHEPGTPREE